jgi:redox-sensitive bicupin YhaK (pirin superfamily)
MITVRPSDERGHANHGWLDTHFTFSFADYYDPEHMGFRSLRVINEDVVAPAQGFGTHPHRNMEIITYVLEGALEHKDSLGTTGVIRPGEVQRITAGAGITHSEYNHSETEPVHLLQIWILPEKNGLKPGYEQKFVGGDALKGKLRLIAARDGRDGAVTVHQDVALYAGALPFGEKVTHALKPGRHAWVQVARGAVTLNGQSLRAGDGAAVSDEPRLEIAATKDAEVLLFDLA